MGFDHLTTTLGAICKQQGGTIQTGPFGSQLHASDYSDRGTPVVMPLNLVNGVVETSGIARVASEHVERLSRHCLVPGDIVFSRRGDVTRFALITERERGWLCGTGCLKVSTGEPTLATANFIAAALASPDSKEWLIRHAVGATMPNLNTGILGRLPIRLPPLSIQEEVTQILDALSDRLQILRQTSTTLEAIAQALFKSWFVDFDPVHAKAEGRTPEAMDAATAALFPSEFEQSELGPIPKGWRAGALKDVCKAHDSKRVPLSRLEREKRRGNYPYYGAASVMDHIDDYIFDGVYVLLAEDGSVATKDGFALTQYVWGRFWVNNHAHILEGIGGFSTEQLLLLLQHVRIHEYITGAVQAKLSQRNMFTIPAVIPPPAISKAFDSLVSPLFAKIREGTEAISTLTSLRDTLLPRLISGKLRLSGVIDLTCAVVEA